MAYWPDLKKDNRYSFMLRQVFHCKTSWAYVTPLKKNIFRLSGQMCDAHFPLFFLQFCTTGAKINVKRVLATM